MKRLHSVLPLHIISKLYYPLIQSQIDYCLSVWGNCPYIFLSTVQKLQNRTARFLTCKYDYKLYSSNLLRIEIKWMSVSERYQYFTSILMYKCMNNPSDHLLNKFFTFTKNVHTYKTRKAEHDHLTIPKHRTEQFKRSLAFSGPKIWKNIDSEVRKLDLHNFKNHIKQNL